jgi:hypothetical protein
MSKPETTNSAQPSQDVPAVPQIDATNYPVNFHACQKVGASIIALIDETHEGGSRDNVLSNDDSYRFVVTDARQPPDFSHNHFPLRHGV